MEETLDFRNKSERHLNANWFAQSDAHRLLLASLTLTKVNKYRTTDWLRPTEWAKGEMWKENRKTLANIQIMNKNCATFALANLWITLSLSPTL